jgi:hypothetical protein
MQLDRVERRDDRFPEIVIELLSRVPEQLWGVHGPPADLDFDRITATEHYGSPNNAARLKFGHRLADAPARQSCPSASCVRLVPDRVVETLAELSSEIGVDVTSPARRGIAETGHAADDDVEATVVTGRRDGLFDPASALLAEDVGLLISSGSGQSPMKMR